ncbi:AAA domain-containing protein [Myxococcota bacterium]|nr:AAA domain-containing protein [Myxococcota bacterium]
MARALRDLAEVRSVLKYWLGTVAYEEALASRPRAQKPSKRAGTVDLFDPGYGQPYFRLGAEHVELIVRGEGAAIVPVEGAVLAFFEHWLRAAYRREAMAARQERVDDSATRWVIGWPGILFERREELATVMRAPIELEWRQRGAPWRPPTFQERRARKSPGLPDSVLIRALEVDDDEEVVMVDRDLLNRVLGVLDEELEQLDGYVDQAGLARRVARMLGGDDVKGGDATALFTSVLDAVRARLPDGVSAYPTAIVQDGALLFATYHLQKELHELLTLGLEAPLSPGTGLWSYLTGDPIEPGWTPLRGRFRARGLTPNQRDTAERALGSKLAAVQGPPGTGKTELILNLAAHTLVARVEALADGLVMSSAPVVVTSTNNRAVDNVTDPLGRELPPARLPIALRTGNQDITATVTRDALDRARTWLLAQDERDALARLNEALERFRVARAALDRVTKPRIDRIVRARKIAALRAELAALPPPEPLAAPHPLTIELRAMDEIVEQLGRMANARRGKVAKILRLWSEKGAAALAEISARDPGLASSIGLPPEDADRDELEAWRASIEGAADTIEAALDDDPQRTKRVRKIERDRIRITELLAALEAGEGDDGGAAPTSDTAAEEAHAHALFTLALEVRERWAIANKGELAPALAAAIEAASEERSLRRFFADDPRGRLSILRLYPVLGVTLLSLGNVFEALPEVIDHLVIDEAGQCHPAYAVSGLMRARRALVIGDVHQLPPVLQLSEHDEQRVRRRLGVKIPEERLAPYRVFSSSTTSAQALADRAVSERPTLVDHFRCQPPIIALSDALSGYGLDVHTPPRSLAARVPRLSSAALFGATRGRQTRARGSWSNPGEAELLARLLLELHDHGVPWSELGVLTPYVGQLDLLRDLLRARGVPFDVGAEPLEATLFGWASGDRGNLSLGTVHRFQGGERSVILFSTVVTEARSLAFLDERPNLLNVAISRARDHLVVLGDPATLARGRHTRILVERCEPLALEGLR